MTARAACRTPKELVLARHPQASCYIGLDLRRVCIGYYFQRRFTQISEDCTTEYSAWRSAATRLRASAIVNGEIHGVYPT